MCCCNDTKQNRERPEELKGKPEDCAQSQIKKCHGDTEVHACAETTDCEHPERLKGKPGECSTEQIRECYGDDKAHSCE